jgi:hypothetical protein
MIFYGSVAKVSSLSGIDSSEITEAMQEIINVWIDENIRQDGFVQYNADEYYDIGKFGQNELVLRHFPVISLSVITKTGSPNESVVPVEDYVIDKESGIIQLINSSSLPRGMNSIRVKYKYGFAIVPDDIAQIANLMLARWAEISAQQDDADGLKQVKIGDYMELRDTGFGGINAKYGPLIDPLVKKAQGKYNIGV